MELLPFLDTTTLMDMSSQCSVICPGSLSVTETSSRSALMMEAHCQCIFLRLPLCYKQILLQVHSTGTMNLSGEGMQVWDVNLHIPTR